MAENVSCYLCEDLEKCFDILALSYKELPPKLKPCFLYFGVFPEDFEIPVRQLIRLWVAEGFIKEDKTRKAEDISEEYLEDLIDRSLIIVLRKSSDGCITSCSIHDLLQDLIIFKGLLENFLVVHSSIKTSTSLPTTTTTKPRRLSVHCKISSRNFWDMQQLRHLFLSGECYCLVKEAKPMPNLETFSTSNSSILCAVDFNQVFPNLAKLGVICSSSCIDIFNELQDVTSIKIINIIGELANPIKADGFSLNLTEITLVRTKLKQSQFAKVAEFPNLQTLKLLKDSLAAGSIMKCNKRGFPQLQVLYMEQLDVNTWSMQSGAMKNLQSLVIRSCKSLKTLPEQLKQMTTLRHITTYGCSFRRGEFGKNVVKRFCFLSECGFGVGFSSKSKIFQN
ncbi:hypothetical protein LguiB_033439 [Lonicera macranthoides]